MLVIFSSFGMLEMSSSSKLPNLGFGPETLLDLPGELFLDLFFISDFSFIVKYLLSLMIPEFSLTLEFKFNKLDFLSFFLSRDLNPDLIEDDRRKLSECLDGE